MNRLTPGILLLACCASLTSAQSPYAPWKNGPPADPAFFPIAVWLQAPRNAPRYKELGINTYVGLWKGPTQVQLDELKKHGMKVICSQDLQFKDHPGIIAWMHDDEPDNAQSRGQGKGYGPPISTQKIIDDYKQMAAKDPTRPILLNLGQGVAYDNYIGRGVRRGKLEDYPMYIQGSDIVSFDIYPANHDKPEIKDQLWYVPKGVTRLREWSNDRKIVWNCIECTPIGSDQIKVTPDQVRSEVWMSIIHGSRGIIYFVHQFKPKFIEAGLLADPQMSKAVATLNAQIHQLAPVINSPAVDGIARVESSNDKVPLAHTARRHQGSTYLFVVALRDGQTQASFQIPGIDRATVEVIGENRTLNLTAGRFADGFAGFAAHLYRLTP